MALFESYERRIDQINAALNKYGIKDIDEAKAICTEKGIDPYKMCEDTQKICFENGHRRGSPGILHPRLRGR